MTMNMNEYQTSDFYSAVVLRTLGFPLVDLIKTNPKDKKVKFSFSTANSKYDPEDVLQDYWNGDLLVNSKKFVESINEIKTRLYDNSR